MAPVLDALAAHMQLGASTPFDFGRCDCTLWVADWVKQRRGVDPAAPWRGRYRTRLGWHRMIRGRSLRDVAGQALRATGARQIEPSSAMPGDIGMVETADGLAMAIRGQSGWLAKTGDGIFRCPTATVAWGL